MSYVAAFRRSVDDEYARLLNPPDGRFSRDDARTLRAFRNTLDDLSPDEPRVAAIDAVLVAFDKLQRLSPGKPVSATSLSMEGSRAYAAAVHERETLAENLRAFGLHLPTSLPGADGNVQAGGRMGSSEPSLRQLLQEALDRRSR